MTSYSQTYDSLGVTLSASGGNLTFNSHEAPIGEYDSDGIGIGDDEASWGQSLSVSFDSSVTVLGYGFLDLFANEGPDAMGEQVAADFGAAGSYLDWGTATDDIGLYWRENLSLADVTQASFSPGGGAYSDFALAGIMVENNVSVPEPGTLALLGSGLLGMVLIGRRRRAAGLSRG